MTAAAYRRIGEVADALGVAPHVLRYWEQELPLGMSTRTRGNQRLFGAEDVARLAWVRERVVTRGVSVRKLRRQIEAEGLPDSASGSYEARKIASHRTELLEELRAIRALLD